MHVTLFYSFFRILTAGDVLLLQEFVGGGAEDNPADQGIELGTRPVVRGGVVADAAVADYAPFRCTSNADTQCRKGSSPQPQLCSIAAFKNTIRIRTVSPYFAFQTNAWLINSNRFMQIILTSRKVLRINILDCFDGLRSLVPVHVKLNDVMLFLCFYIRIPACNRLKLLHFPLPR